METLTTEASAAQTSALRGIKVSYSDGSTICTSMAAHLTDEQMLDYFKVGAKFNLGYNAVTGSEDNMQSVVSAEILPDEGPRYITASEMEQVKREYKEQYHPEPAKPILAHLLPLAQRAYNWTSFNPEKRGQQTVNDYSAELSADIQSIKDAAAKNSDIDADKLEATIERYTSKYTQHLSAYLYSHSNTASSFITGGSNFPVRRQEKLHRWADNKYEFFREYRARTLNAIIKSFKKPVNLLESYRKDLSLRLRAQELYKEANKAFRKHKGNEVALLETLVSLGFTESNARKIMIPDFANRIGVPSYKLTNNLANIKRLQGRIIELENKAFRAKTIGTASKMFGEVEVIKNHEEDRLQIKYPGKPDAQTIGTLKRNGFRWSPRFACWQCFLSNYERRTAVVLNVELNDVRF